MINQGMVDVQTMDSTIRVSLMYARPDNFTGKILYTDISHAYLHPNAAKALVKAQAYLKEKHPEWSLIVFDACRPMSIQQRMWNVVAGTSKSIYVSNPAHGGGLHNYGMAVDISICNNKGDTISMGVPVDYLGTLAHIDREAEFAEKGRLSQEAINHRKILREIMRKAGFTPLRTEWWHFNFISRATARKYYKYVK